MDHLLSMETLHTSSIHCSVFQELHLENLIRMSYTNHPLSGDDGERVTPVPIPNTEVKSFSADGTWGATPWESRTSPGW